MRNPNLPYRLAVLHDLAAVTDLLDCLENAGCAERWVKILGERRFRRSMAGERDDATPGE